MISMRSKLSLCQFLELQERGLLKLLLEKHGFPTYPFDNFQLMEALRETMLSGQPEQMGNLLSEVVKTHGDLRNRVQPRYRFDERWRDLVGCLGLDGYRVEPDRLVVVDPTIEAAAPFEDDLSTELRCSGLSEAEDIIRMLNNSAEAFRKLPPDYNACLSDARVVLQTLGTAIAKTRLVAHTGTFDETKWGQVLSYLRTSGFIIQSEEEAIAGVFGFVSPGAHTPMGLTEQEMARLGRSDLPPFIGPPASRGFGW